MSDKELLNLIKSEYERIKPKNFFEFFEKRDRRIPCHPKLRKRFNKTYNGILLLAGVKESEIKFIRSETRGQEYYLKGLKQLAEELGKSPTIEEYRDYGYSPEMLKKHYKFYNDALKEAGLETNYKHIAKDLSKEDIIDIYIEISNKVGRPATIREIRENYSEFNPQIFLKYFTSINTLRREAGLEESNRGKLLYTKHKIKNILIEAHKEYGRRLTPKDIRKNKDLPSYGTIIKYFKAKSLNDVWEEVELDMWLTKEIAS